jgi:hypothetical protein
MTLQALCTRLLPAAALVLCTASPVNAGWPNSPLVNVPLDTSIGDQNYPAVVSDGAGGAIVTWYDTDIHAQRIATGGAAQWLTDGVSLCGASGIQQFPAIASDDAGGAIVTWQDGRGGWIDIYAQRVSAAGAVLWASDGVAICMAVDNQFTPAIVPDGTGGAIVAWYDRRNVSSIDVYAQRISAAGVVQWTANGVALCTGTVFPYDSPVIVPDGAGGAIVAWQDSRNGSSNLDIFAQRISAGGTVQWATNGVAVCAAAGVQDVPAMVSDDAGGAVLLWRDARTGSTIDLHAQRISAAGAVQWSANGVALCSATADLRFPVITSDGAGGAIAAWYDSRTGGYDVYAQRISAAGAVQWTASGVPLCTASGEQQYPAIVPDGAGGAIVVWHDSRTGTYDIYIQRISAAGAVQWAADGLALCTAHNIQEYPAIAADGAGGAIAAWMDGRSNNNMDIYAQRVDRWGYLGVQPPSLSVRDVPNDQGGQVSVYWSASPLDSFPAYAISDYFIWRQVPSSLAQAALARGARVLPAGATPEGTPRGAIRATTSATGTYYWELVDGQVAQGFPGYSYVAPTTCDSVAGANPRTAFMIEARGAQAQQWWFSDPDSGYSVDNLAPATPSPFTGQYLGGTTRLHWGVSTAADFATFRLYRGTTVGFVPAAGNLVVSKVDTGYVDVAGSPYYYKVCAVDIHGNVSAYAFLQPSGTAGVPPGTLPHELALSAPAPNPLRGASTLRLALPRAAHVSLAVFDQQGRRVRTLADGELAAGEHPFTWDGRDDGGRAVASALYFVRLETGGRAISRRLVVVR